MRNRAIVAATALAVLAGCSSRPREFTPTLSAVLPDQPRFDAAVTECRQLFVAGKLDSSGRLASGGAGAAAGAAMGVAGGAAASGAGLYAGAAIASATLVAIPFVVLGGAWGMAKIKRHKKEKAIQTAMGGCLRERGYEVASWKRAPKVAAKAKVAAAE
jgi:hypothetical protein